MVAGSGGEARELTKSGVDHSVNQAGPGPGKAHIASSPLSVSQMSVTGQDALASKPSEMSFL